VTGSPAAVAPARPDVALRPLRWWDVADALALENLLFPDAWTEPMFWSELAGVPDTRFYVAAVADERLVGYAGLFVAGTDADVQTVAVDPSRQGAGVGGLLLDALLDEATRRRCSRVTLEVRAGNEAARALYTRRGFAPIGVRRGYYPATPTSPAADADVLQLRLPARSAPPPASSVPPSDLEVRSRNRADAANQPQDHGGVPTASGGGAS
jgi:ribosomal-protein-alanine N-acetyltransferase